MTREERDAAIRAIIVDAIDEGANEWDAYALPETEKTSARALARIKELIDDQDA